MQIQHFQLISSFAIRQDVRLTCHQWTHQKKLIQHLSIISIIFFLDSYFCNFFAMFVQFLVSLSHTFVHAQIISIRLGFISLDEFGEACDLLQKHLPEHDTKEGLMEMCKLMVKSKKKLKTKLERCRYLKKMFVSHRTLTKTVWSIWMNFWKRFDCANKKKVTVIKVKSKRSTYISICHRSMMKRTRRKAMAFKSEILALLTKIYHTKLSESMHTGHKKKRLKREKLKKKTTATKTIKEKIKMQMWC